MKALDIFAYALAFFKEQALKVTPPVTFNQSHLYDTDGNTQQEAERCLLCSVVTRLFTMSFASTRFTSQELSDQTAGEFDNDDVRWVITVPAIWKMPAKQFMREAAYKVTDVSDCTQ